MQDRTALDRRQLLGAAAGLATAAFAGHGTAAVARAEDEGVYKARNGNLKQSIVHWCFNAFGEKWSIEQTCEAAVKLGCQSVELVGPEEWPTLKKHGLTCAIATIDMSPDDFPFLKGFNNPQHRPKVMQVTRDTIDAAAANGVPSVICFTGMADGIPDDVGADNCVEGLKEIAGHAEKKNVSVHLEMLNTRDESHPMKGHPGYQGNHTDYCIDILKRVGSDRVKLLFDVYHVQIMDGDVIRRIRQHAEWIGHVHTAGNPGRGELGSDQEINYPAVMQALADVKYKGFVGQEFIPTKPPMVGLSEAVRLCDV
jgi:hydroxypyruvate isomerase